MFNVTNDVGTPPLFLQDVTRLLCKFESLASSSDLRASQSPLLIGLPSNQHTGTRVKHPKKFSTAFVCVLKCVLHAYYFSQQLSIYFNLTFNFWKKNAKNISVIMSIRVNFNFGHCCRDPPFCNSIDLLGNDEKHWVPGPKQHQAGKK